jgi:ParB/RepB/Spo0J family partition protein
MAEQEFVSLKVAAEKKIHGDGVAKETIFRVDPRLIEVEPGFNRPISRENVEQFKTAIRNGATIPPIYVRVDAGHIVMVDGEHRLIAVRELIAEGVEIESMSAVQFRGNDADRVAHLLTSAQGQPLSPLEAGLQYAKLIRFGWDRKKIADRVGRSVTHVEQCLILAEADSDVQSSVRAGEVSSTTAANIVKKHGSRAGQVIRDNLAEAKANGKSKVTASTVAPKAKPRKFDGEITSIRQNGDQVVVTLASAESASRFHEFIKAA